MKQETIKLLFIRFGIMKDEKGGDPFNWGNGFALSSFSSNTHQAGFEPIKIDITPDDKFSVCLRLRDDLIKACELGFSFIEIEPSYTIKAKKGVSCAVIGDYKLVTKLS